METIWERQVARNSGLAFEMQRGQAVRLYAPAVIDFIALNRTNVRERFDQARTKANQRKIYVTKGDCLISKLNNSMMTIAEDTFDYGHHDLQSGGCSRKRFELLAGRNDLELTYGRPIRPEDIPDHGCWENLSRALEPWGVAPEDVPSPFNVFQDMRIDGKTGSMEHSPVRARPGTFVILRAEMDLIAALSVCPDLIAGGSGGGVVTLLTGA